MAALEKSPTGPNQIAIIMHGSTIMGEPLILPPETYLITFSPVGSQLKNTDILQDWIKSQFHRDGEVASLFENNNTEETKTSTGKSLEQLLIEREPNVSIRIHMPGSTTSNTLVVMEREGSTFIKGDGIYVKSVEGRLLKSEHLEKNESRTLKEIIENNGKGVYFLVVCRGFEFSTIERNFIVYLKRILKSSTTAAGEYIKDFLSGKNSGDMLETEIDKPYRTPESNNYYIDRIRLAVKECKKDKNTTIDNFMHHIITSEIIPPKLSKQYSHETDISNEIFSNVRSFCRKYYSPEETDEIMNFLYSKSTEISEYIKKNPDITTIVKMIKQGIVTLNYVNTTGQPQNVIDRYNTSYKTNYIKTLIDIDTKDKQSQTIPKKYKGIDFTGGRKRTRRRKNKRKSRRFR